MIPAGAPGARGAPEMLAGRPSIHWLTIARVARSRGQVAIAGECRWHGRIFTGQLPAHTVSPNTRAD
jgi:hypothetical protein